VGETEDKLGTGYVSDTVAEADFVVSAWLVAATVTEPELGTKPGAVYRPVEEMVPTVLLPPAVLLTDQVTAVLLVLLTVAVNCCVPSTITEALVGEMETATAGGGVTAELPPPPQEDIRRQDSAAIASKAKMTWLRNLLDVPDSSVLMSTCLPAPSR
jgi:hypothetical protein